MKKRIRKIVAYGCSFTQGAGIDRENPLDIHPKSWPFLVSKNLGTEQVINRAQGGGSNKFSMIRLFTDIISEDLSDTLIIFSWTSIFRTVYFDSTKHNWETIMINSNLSDKKLKNAYDHYYSTIFTEYEATYDLIQQQLFLQAFLKERNIEHVFVNGIRDNQDLDPFLFKLESIIDKNNYALGYYDSISNEVSRNNFRCYDQYHPTEEGYVHIANLITQFIKEKYA